MKAIIKVVDKAWYTSKNAWIYFRIKLSSDRLKG